MITLLGKLLKGLLQPRRVALPPLFWLLLLGGMVAIALRTETPVVIGSEAQIQYIVLTPTPGHAPAAPAITPTPIGSGGTLAFAMRHNGNTDIYAISQSDGKLLRLTYDPAEDRDPAWSPDGRWLAFTSRRSNSWDLYLFDATSGAIQRITRDPGFVGGPSWSPDSLWLAYEYYHEDNLDIYIISIDGQQRHRLTTHPAPNYSPAWSPDGRHIAFTSFRNGNQDIYIFPLDGGEDLVVNLTNTPEQNEDNAAWSPDGDYIVYSSGNPGDEYIRMLPFSPDVAASGELRSMPFGIGGSPTWSPDGTALAYVLRQGMTSRLIAASATGWAMAQEGYSSTDWMDSPSWTSTTLAPDLIARLEARMTEPDPPLYTELFLGKKPDDTYQLVNLPNVNRSDRAEQLSDRVNDSYNAMRRRVEEETGWDYLAILGDSWRTMNHTPRPGQGRISWHVCGRAVDINQGFLTDRRIELVREDISGVTFWRVYIQAARQDGSMGEPLRRTPWDLSARSKGGLATALGGELRAEIPSGYYVDFTTIAADYGWERRNALSNWRNSYFDIEWWHFQKTEGLSWYECMVELYPEEEVIESYGQLPWWTKLPEMQVVFLP